MDSREKQNIEQRRRKQTRKSKRRPSKKNAFLIPFTIVIALIVIIGIAILIIGKSSLKNADSPIPAVESYMESLKCNLEPTPLDESIDGSDVSKALESLALGSVKSFSINGYSTFFKTATVTGVAECVDMKKMAEGLDKAVNDTLVQIVDEARKASDVYNDDDTFKLPVIIEALNRVFRERLEDSSYCSSKKIVIKAKYSDGVWTVTKTSPFEDSKSLLKTKEKLLNSLEGKLTYVEKHYYIPEEATAGPKPDQACYGVTTDPNVVVELINSKIAQRLLKGQTLSWNPDIERIEGSEINYYLDDSILAIEWQEYFDDNVATYTESVIADGSQFRKKTVGDVAWGDYDIASNLAAQANAVFAVGGDFYNHPRECGIVVLNREIVRFEPYTADTCFVNTDGDFLFVRRGEFTERSQAEQFVEENDIIFSIAFGPVIIEDGKDVTPDEYPWGEINDIYSRSAIGIIGQHHYLTVNLNDRPWAFLYQATNAMLRYGCQKAYTLDGGQTACTIFNNRLINPVQFGFERDVSDILYFATAIN